jgi:glutaredoxin
MGSQGTPTIVIDGEMFIGFEPEKLEKKLGIA